MCKSETRDYSASKVHGFKQQPADLASFGSLYPSVCAACKVSALQVACGYSEFVQAAQQSQGRLVFILFCGDKDAQGRSWCLDCVTAEPVVRSELNSLPNGAVVIYCQVGDQAYWKDPNNEFRKNLKLTAVPTLLKYGTPQKLVEEECLNRELVHMLFTED
ncbi:thioredoxin domain-containing protein 17-like [Chelonoidis abingdonii]|uniref:thioredoxin domain-containing protein 17-like n=1 Tax=Chelonoidis abingdonii TaxID=106734 RepID=UPI0013F1F252|nr:thioredoxin domain-containing protein 17-like [Chelonoidis abingdonii]